MDLKSPAQYIPAFLKIRDKRGRMVKFRFNSAQRRFCKAIADMAAAGKPVRVIVLKARQLGFSTMTAGLIFHDSATREGVYSLVVAHRDDSTANLFRMYKLMKDELPGPLLPMIKASNAQEILFENPTKDPEAKAKNPGLRSRIRCVTAGGSGIGRSDTLTNVHLSEFAFWPGDKTGTLSGILQAVPQDPDTMVVIESTANGFDEFKKLWDAAVAGENDFLPFFSAWHENEEYKMPVPSGTVWSEAELALKKAFSLSDEQLAWRRWCIRNNCNKDERIFRQEYPATPDEAFLTSGDGVFDNEALTAQMAVAPAPVAVGTFVYDYDGLKITNIKFVETAGGEVTVYKMPQPDVPYVVGGDTAGEGSDWFTGQVLDNTTGAQAAVLRRRLDEGIYARQMYCLGRWYNTALIAIEANYSTYTTMELQRLGYPRQYVRESFDTYTKKPKQSYGYLTTAATRPVMVANLVDVARETPELIVDKTTLSEMRTFVYDEHRRPAALEGEHDDLVMALAIAHMARGQQATAKPKAPHKKAKWEPDMWEDYNRATPADKERLIERWGNPF